MVDSLQKVLLLHLPSAKEPCVVRWPLHLSYQPHMLCCIAALYQIVCCPESWTGTPGLVGGSVRLLACF